MNIIEAINARHSVRRYIEKALEPDIALALQNEIEACNKESGLHIQLVANEPRAFDGFMAHYGKFSGVANYIALIGKKGADLDEKCGYYGERITLKAQQLGLNSCWVAMSYSKIKGAYKVNSGEKLCLVIAIGYGKTQGVAHKSKSAGEVCDAVENAPKWFINGVEAALLAPTAMNQQKFRFSLNGNRVTAKPGMGFYTKVDLGIAKYHFEAAAGRDNFIWV
ncbi:MAG: nitroreductase family protein [Eubacterium sp.]